ncbi:hypothetical protein Q671_12640 [Halomonas sp. PBN3]|nr:hypothetical protein Q671_12640 [Halomonas sp. PBN3]
MLSWKSGMVSNIYWYIGDLSLWRKIVGCFLLVKIFLR